VTGSAPVGVRARAQYGPSVLVLRELLAGVGLLHVDETPGRAAGGLSYVHLAFTEFLAVMRTGGRSKADIDASGVLLGYQGTIVRDGYGGYTHRIEAHHAWCGAHLLRDLAAVHTAEPDWAVLGAAMANTSPRPTSTPPPRAPPAATTSIRPPSRRSVTDTRRVRRGHQRQHHPWRTCCPRRAAAGAAVPRARNHDPTVRGDLAVPWTNNLAGRDVRTVMVQQHAAGGCWCPCKAWPTSPSSAPGFQRRKWGIDSLDAFEQLPFANAGNHAQFSGPIDGRFQLFVSNVQVDGRASMWFTS